MKYEDQRKLMVSRHIAFRGIHNPLLINAFEKVPRHLFVPPDYRKMAYSDHPLEIGQGQTISQPYIVALMLDLLSLKPEDIVLDIGTGSGYQTALLAEIVSEVYTVERIPELAIKARETLKNMGYTNIHFRVGDGTKGWEKAYPARQSFNKIVVSAASPDVPPTLIKQLADKGRMVLPTGNRLFQELKVISKENGDVKQSIYGGCTFVPLIGEEGWEK